MRDIGDISAPMSDTRCHIRLLESHIGRVGDKSDVIDCAHSRIGALFCAICVIL